MRITVALALLGSLAQGYPAGSSRAEPGLIGYWKLQGDCRDHSGHENHGVNHGVQLGTGFFGGISAYVEIPSHRILRLGAGDFTVCAWVHTQQDLDDVVGDVVDLYDPNLR